MTSRRLDPRALVCCALAAWLLLAPAAARAFDTVVTGGVSDYALRSPALYWHEAAPCLTTPDGSGVPGNELEHTRIRRMATRDRVILSTEPRSLLDENQPRAVGACNPYVLGSNVSADDDFVYFVDSGGTLRRLSRLANPGDPAAPIVSIGSWSGKGEVVSAGAYLFVVHPTRAGVYRVTKADGTIQFAALFDCPCQNISYDGTYAYWLQGTSNTLTRVDPVSLGKAPIASSVSGYYPEGYRLQVISPFEILATHYVFYAQGGAIWRFDNLDGAYVGIYSSAEPLAQIQSLVSDGTRLFFIEQRPVPSTFSSDYYLFRTGEAGGAVLGFAGFPLRDNFLTSLSTNGTFVFWRNGTSGALQRIANNEVGLPVVNLRITGMEVTQGIQDLQNTTRLVRDRRTFVRVYVASDGPLVNGVTAVLQGPGATLYPVNEVGKLIGVKPCCQGSDAAPKRDNLDDSFLFELPMDWTRIDGVVLHAELNPGRFPLEPTLSDNGSDLGPLTFLPSPRLRLQLVGWNYLLQGDRSVSTGELDGVVSLFRRIYPLAGFTDAFWLPGPGLRWSFRSVRDASLASRVDGTHKDCKDNLCATGYVLSRMEAMRNRGEIDLYTSFTLGLVAAPPAGTCSGLCVRGQSYGYRIAAAESDRETDAVHEVGHELGRMHPARSSQCGHTQEDGAYPFSSAKIGDVTTTWAGLDPGDPRLDVETSYRDQSINSDFMSYCPPYWTSRYTYEALYDAMTASSSSAAAGAASVSAAAGAEAGPSLLPGDWVSAFGHISPATGTAVFDEIRRLDAIAAQPARTPGAYRLRLLSGSGATLADYAFTPAAGEDGDDQLSFGLIEPFAPGTREIRLVEGATGRVFGHVPVSASAPTLSGLATLGETGNLARAAGAVASQSSTPTTYGTPASRAVDGNRDGNYFAGSVTHTDFDLHAWWQIDLGAVEPIDRVAIHPRTDCCPERNRIAVLVASSPFVASDFTAAQLPAVYANGAVEVYRTSAAFDSTPLSIPVNASARYVRVVHLAQDYLSLAEVEVTGQLSLAWSASDADGGPLAFDVLFSRDGGASYRPLQLGLSASPAVIDTSSLGGPTAQLRVVATDGVLSTHADTPPFALPVQPPVPRIANPAPGTTVEWNQLINFMGEADDAQDGAVAASGLTWTAQRPGSAVRNLGTGTSLSITDLAVGTNTVTLTAVDSLGASASTSIIVVVSDDLNDPGPTLTAGPAPIGWTVAPGETALQYGELDVSNAGSGTLDFSATSNAAWLTVSPASGTAPLALSLSANPAGLPGGTKLDALVTISATAYPQTIQVPVTLAIGNTFAPTPDFDRDGVRDPSDLCPTVADDQADADMDGVGDACDVCSGVANPRFPSASLLAWMTVVSGQRDDDGDGLGNLCDFDHDGAGPVINASDFNLMKASVGKLASGQNCGTSANLRCGKFDQDEFGPVINASDFNLMKAKVGTLKGKSCGAACTPPFGGLGKALCSGPAC